MKNKLTYTFAFLFTFFLINGQTKHFSLTNGNCQLFNGAIFCYGISAQNQAARFLIYKLDPQLKLTDSLFIEAGKGTPDDYLPTYSDTLHDYLNIYFQKKDKKAVTVLRFNKKFELIARIDNVDIARLNNTSIFGGKAHYFKNSVYSIKTEKDTSGTQFYLNKYALKSETTNYDYEFKWQFPFERKNIRSAHIFFANKNHALLFVVVEDGTKAGQWVLRISAETGKLEKATKLNEKGETSSYLFGISFIDKNYKSVSIAGQKFTEAQYSPKQNKLSILNAPTSAIYYLEIDSLGEIAKRQDFKVPINDVKTGVKKTANGYLLRFYNINKAPDGSISLGADIFKSMNSNLCYLYSNTNIFNLLPVEDNFNLEKNSISPDLQVEQYYFNTDKLDMNGKLCIDSLTEFEELFFKPLAFPVKQQFKTDAEKNPLWILSKHTTKKNEVNYSFLSPVKKIYQLSIIETLNEVSNPVLLPLSSGSFIICHQAEEGKYQLKLYNW